MSPSSEIYFTIPNTLQNWPWPRHINPHYNICKAESSAWCEGFKAFTPKAQKAFNKCDFNLLASLAYPLLNKEGCRVGCDLMNLFFVIDEYSDVADQCGAREQADIVMDALRHPLKPRPEGEWIGGEIARQFWENATRTATPSAQRRFIKMFDSYLNSVVQQAEDRTHNYIRDIQSYFDVRRDTIGAKPSFAINEIHLNISDEAMEDPIIKTLASTSIDMLIIGNDLCSYNVEQARGDDGHNLVTIVMNERKIGLHAALQWISNLHDRLAAEFLEAYKKLPSPINPDVATYVDGLGNWVRGNDVWSFESERYFGVRGLEIQNSRIVQLLPKEKGEQGNTGLIPSTQGISVSTIKPSGFIQNILSSIWIKWGVTFLVLMLSVASLRSIIILHRYELF
ncbi:terpenoid synthase [Collybia nuda]|uniref:Terpene synthase n=1 Tax=Collybia nuda TaxID=64659 RepID=A0A9P5Y3E4_9AGAR|nr:terpenoid synthase [Collybia nuda]